MIITIGQKKGVGPNSFLEMIKKGVLNTNIRGFFKINKNVVPKKGIFDKSAIYIKSNNLMPQGLSVSFKYSLISVILP